MSSSTREDFDEILWPMDTNSLQGNTGKTKFNKYFTQQIEIILKRQYKGTLKTRKWKEIRRGKE